MEKEYMAIWDDGHDTGDFVFWSSHRAKSKQNIEDAMNEYRKRHGRRNIEIIDVYRK